MWVTFERLFVDKYFPKDTQNAMQSKFFNLKQGDMSVSKYETKFSALARFATTQFTNDDLQGTWFEEGLKPGIQSKLAPRRLKSFADILAVALAIESKDLQSKKSREANCLLKHH